MKILRTKDGKQKLVRVSTGFVLDFALRPIRSFQPGLTELDIFDLFRDAHKAAGRDPNQDAHGRFIENQSDALEVWNGNYQSSTDAILEKFEVS